MDHTPPQAATPGAGRTFRYEARRPDGRTINGTIDADSHEHAMSQLTALRLDVLDIRDLDRPARAGTMTAADLQSFNQHLAYLTEAGLPVEAGLRMIAREASNKRIGETIQQIADETEQGKSLAEAVEAHRDKFPALYSQLIDAGLKSSNLPGMLLNLGRHLTLVSEMRNTIWRTMAYPLFLVGMVCLLLIMLSMFVLPGFKEIYTDFGTELPGLTLMVFGIGRVMPWILLVMGALAAAGMTGYSVLWARGHGPLLVDAILLPTPVLGGIVRRTMTARWCDAVNIGIEGGIALPRAIDLAANAIGSPSLRQDSDELIGALEQGVPITSLPAMRVIPDTVCASLEFARHGEGLALALQSMTRLYIDQTSMRLNLLTIYLPLLTMVVIGAVMVPLVFALFLPMLRITTSLT